jgi:hypothetical protein
MSPTLVLRDGQPLMALGTPAGFSGGFADVPPEGSVSQAFF